MDSENKILMTVDTGNSVKTIADLKKQIQELKKALDQEVVGSESAKKATEELANAQNELKQAIKGSTDVIEIAKGSYYDLNRQCEQLKVTYKSMADGIEKAKIGKRIAEIQEELKKQDAAIGDFKRNVGDYANSFTTALSSMGVGTTTLSRGLNLVTTGTKNFSNALNILKAHPVILAISAFILLLKGLVDAFKKNYDAVKKLEVAFAPFVGILNGVMNVVDDLTDWIGDKLAKALSATADLMRGFFQTIGADNIVQRMDEAKKLAEDQQAIEQKQVDMIKTRADLEADLAVAREQFKLHAKDEEKAYEDVVEIERIRKQLLQDELDLVKAQYKEKQLYNAQNKSTTADTAAENELYAKMLDLQTQIRTNSEEYVKFMRTASAETRKKFLDTEIKELEDAKRELDAVYAKMVGGTLVVMGNGEDALNNPFLKRQKEIGVEIEKLQKQYENLQKTYTLDAFAEPFVSITKKDILNKVEALVKEWEQLSDKLAKETDDNEKELKRLEKDIARKKQEEKNAEQEEADKKAEEAKKRYEEYLKRRQDLEKSLQNWSMTELERLEAQYNEELKLLGNNNEKKLILDQKYAVERNKIYATAARRWAEEQMKNAGDTSSMVNYENVNFNEIKANHKLTEDEEYEHQRRLLEIQKWGLEERQRIMDENLINTEAFHNLSLDDQSKYLQEYEKLTEQISLVNSQLSANDAENARRRAEAAKAEKQMKLDAYLDMADAIGSIFTSIADTMDENNEKQFEAAKAFNIAGATINTITGAIDAYMGAVGNTGLNAIPVVGPAIAMAMGITNAAAVTAAGVANIAKIARQKYNGGASGANATASFSASSGGISAVNAPLQMTSSVEGAAINDSIQSQKVIVVESDISDTMNKVRVEESENRY